MSAGYLRSSRPYATVHPVHLDQRRRQGHGRGARVVIADINPDGAERVANSVRSTGAEMATVQANVADPHSVDAEEEIR